MAWLAVDKNGLEYIYGSEPYRGKDSWLTHKDDYIKIPNGTIKKIIGKELTWDDEPVELENNDDHESI